MLGNNKLDMPEEWEEIISDIPLSDIVAQRIKLKKSGKLFNACCPFHDEETPSFTVDDEKGKFHCFGCGANGNVIEFVIRYDRITLSDALNVLTDVLNDSYS